MTAIAALPLFAHDAWGHPWWPIWPIHAGNADKHCFYRWQSTRVKEP